MVFANLAKILMYLVLNTALCVVTVWNEEYITTLWKPYAIKFICRFQKVSYFYMVARIKNALKIFHCIYYIIYMCTMHVKYLTLIFKNCTSSFDSNLVIPVQAQPDFLFTTCGFTWSTHIIGTFIICIS